jgi:hypothetical protein
MQIDPWSKMLFVHIPRTGGSWFTYSWRMNYDRSGAVRWSTRELLMNSSNHNTVRVGRHGKLSGIKKQLQEIHLDINDYKIITLVREPLDRVLSSWKWFSIVKETAKKHGWTSIDDMLDEYESGERRVNYMPQTRWLLEPGAKYDHIFRFEDLLKGPEKIQKVFPEYNPKGRLRRTVHELNITDKQIDRIKVLYKDDFEYLRKFYDQD